MKTLILVLFAFLLFSLANASVTATVRIIGPPDVSVNITPSYATDSTDLKCVWNITDTENYTYKQNWYQNGALTTFPETVPAAATKPGDVWTCEVSATNSDNATAIKNATITVSPEITITGLFGLDVNSVAFEKFIIPFVNLLRIFGFK
jgi:hypothetical protein